MFATPVLAETTSILDEITEEELTDEETTEDFLKTPVTVYFVEQT